MKIMFDMDGTIANLYGVENWLDFLIAEDTKPYEVAKPMLNLSALARVLNRLVREGNEIGVISWTSKCGSASYNEAVADVKREWLAKHLPSVQFSVINIVPYGTPKSLFGGDILFDDEKGNRDEWGFGAFDEKDIMEVLKSL